MSPMRDVLKEGDLLAYVDGQLSLTDRIRVETQLARDPAAAARVMADMRDRDALRLSFETRGHERPGTTEAARRLNRALRTRRWAVGLRSAAVALFMLIGWTANEMAGPIGIRRSVASALPPAFVADALMAHRTSELREHMASQPEAKRLDASEIRAATAIVMPTLPEAWVVDDVQVFPSPLGPSVETAILTERFGRLSLFAVRPGTFDVTAPKLSKSVDAIAAYWQVGDVAYALVTRSPGRDALAEAAERLARSLH